MIKELRTASVTRVWYYRRGSAGGALRPDDIPDDLIAGAAVLHVTGITPGLSGTAAAAVRHATEVARRNGTTISVGINYRSQIWEPGTAAPVLAGLVREADVVFAGREEASLVVPGTGDALDAAEALTRLGPSQAIVTQGADGAVAVIEGQPYRQPAVAVRAVDPVGAGDAFAAGYLAGLVSSSPPEERLRTAAAVAAFACAVPGDWAGLPWRHELDLADATENVLR
jgi:2-dehydro-3-deoxygluconokinase